MIIQNAISRSLIDPTGKPRPAPIYGAPAKIRKGAWPESWWVEIRSEKSKIWSFYTGSARPGAWTPAYEDIIATDWEAVL